MRETRFWGSVQHACYGIVHALKTQRNMRIHVLAALLVLLAAWWLEIPRSDVLLVFFAIGLVITMELMNTAVEAVVDLVTSEWREQAKMAKDTAAGAVLLAAMTAVVIGIWVFGLPLADKLAHLLKVITH
ncbi:MAG: diacylglycerol kinase family protein [Brevibacillus sp.]|nr:diacylglycerol kinase family protein [Brevibacillus sp.]